VRAAGVQRGDVLALGVQRVCGDHRPGQVHAVAAAQGVEQRGETADLAGLAVHRDLAEHDPRVLVDHREQMPTRHLGPVAAQVSGAGG